MFSCCVCDASNIFFLCICSLIIWLSFDQKDIDQGLRSKSWAPLVVHYHPLEGLAAKHWLPFMPRNVRIFE